MNKFRLINLYDSKPIEKRMAAVRWIVLSNLFFFLVVGNARSEITAENIMEPNNRPAVILIQIRGKTKDGVEHTEIGTAFFISANGFALTAAHLFYAGGQSENEGNHILAFPEKNYAEGKLGSAGESPKQFQVVRLYKDIDIALIHLFDPLGPVAHVSLCADIPSTDEMIFAFGYAGGMSLKKNSGHINGSLEGNSYPTDMTINPGQSGGPVFSKNGKVFAVNIGGVREESFQNYNYVMPVQFLTEPIHDAGEQTSCLKERPKPIKSVQSTTVPSLMQGQSTIMDGFVNYAFSGISLKDRQIIAYNDPRGDFYASRNPQIPNSLLLFFPFNDAQFPAPGNPQAGYAPSSNPLARNVDDCKGLTYSTHWMVPYAGQSYCIRGRDGTRFGKIWIAGILPDRIWFDWIFEQ